MWVNPGWFANYSETRRDSSLGVEGLEFCKREIFIHQDELSHFFGGYRLGEAIMINSSLQVGPGNVKTVSRNVYSFAVQSMRDFNDELDGMRFKIRTATNHVTIMRTNGRNVHNTVVGKDLDSHPIWVGIDDLCCDSDDMMETNGNSIMDPRYYSIRHAESDGARANVDFKELTHGRDLSGKELMDSHTRVFTISEKDFVTTADGSSQLEVTSYLGEFDVELFLYLDNTKLRTVDVMYDGDRMSISNPSMYRDLLCPEDLKRGFDLFKMKLRAKHAKFRKMFGDLVVCVGKRDPLYVVRVMFKDPSIPVITSCHGIDTLIERHVIRENSDFFIDRMIEYTDAMKYGWDL